MFPIARYSLIIAASLMVSGAAYAAGDSAYGEDFTLSIIKQEAAPLNAQGKVIVAQVSRGTNKNTGSEDFMDGAQIVAGEVIDLDNGNGPENGVISFAKDGASESYRYSGTLTTVMTGDHPETTAQGSWKSIDGDILVGSGTYRFTMTSKTELKGHWQGHLSKVASR